SKLKLPLSVPSSSGKGLQPIQYGFLVISCITFSPLFIGEGSSTFSGPAVLLSLLEHFQSPLHRGRVFNRDTADCTSRLTDTFSPLFIGDGSSTNLLSYSLFPQTTLSVPSSSGKGLQPPDNSHFGKPGERLSVPSSSGKGLQPVTKDAILPVNQAFSPLFIGEGSSTWIIH